MSPPNPWARLPRRELAQQRFIADLLRGAIGPLPWLGAITRVEAGVQPLAADPPVYALEMQAMAGDGSAVPLLSLHLDRWDLQALGLAESFVRTAPIEALYCLLAPAAEPLRAALEQRVGAPVALRLAAASTPWPAPGMAPVTLHARGAVPWLRIGVSGVWAHPLPEVASAPLPPQGAAWPLELTLALRIAGPSPEQLAPGDWWRLLPAGESTWPAQLLAGADLRPIGRAALTLDPNVTLSWSVTTMNDPSPAGEPELLPDLPVAIEIHLPHQTLRLRELTALAPGVLVDLCCAATDVELTLLSAGSAFARGRFVHVGANLGVEVTRLLRDES